jgi:hypothetical protein
MIIGSFAQWVFLSIFCWCVNVACSWGKFVWIFLQQKFYTVNGADCLNFELNFFVIWVNKNVGFAWIRHILLCQKKEKEPLWLKKSLSGPFMSCCTSYDDKLLTFFLKRIICKQLFHLEGFVSICFFDPNKLLIVLALCKKYRGLFPL